MVVICIQWHCRRHVWTGAGNFVYLFFLWYSALSGSSTVLTTVSLSLFSRARARSLSLSLSLRLRRA